MKYRITFVRKFLAEIEADWPLEAKRQADNALKPFGGDAILLSITAEDYVERECPGCAHKHEPQPTPPPFSTPPDGQTPGGKPAVVPPPVDAIAAAA